jgi:hypothetical protein
MSNLLLSVRFDLLEYIESEDGKGGFIRYDWHKLVAKVRMEL